MPLPDRVAGNLALDLANTVSWRGTAREFDHLADAQAILAWAKLAGLTAREFQPSASQLATLVRDVHRLRGAVAAAGAAIACGGTPPRHALATIRDYTAGSLAAARLSGVPATLDFSRTTPIIGPLAWAALDLLRGDELARLKQCPPDDCRWLFIDRTKNGSRRWCSMAACGDRAKKDAQR